ncbi:MULTISPECIES: hypothetical protein [Pseudanabaena]|uniref:Uncharacterized protein n=2 Tax=Pseudanabaena TaxID=1152 RepID=L8N235_9CYAN|nr:MULTISPECIES: hypothetical protein [Pseudanabaena]ELS32790.1 hypothetical protein Pse7429DRAFT_1995 [Pseudanabaena biceps PCC 7429]MDG3494976.1 hypothetical protein [Pseudanabaena catenata USMAC16]
MALKTYKGTVGSKEFFLKLPDSYSEIASDLGFETTTSADFVTGTYVASHKELLQNGIIFQLTLGLAGGKRGRCLISADKLANQNALVDKSFNSKVIKSVSIRTFSKLQ